MRRFILLSGANSGIGLETTQVFLGMITPSVHILIVLAEYSTHRARRIRDHYRSSADTLAPLASQYDARLRLAKADVTSEDDVRALFTAASASTGSASPGPVEVLVVNHGYYAPPHR